MLALLGNIESIFGENNLLQCDAKVYFNRDNPPVDIEALAERYENPDFWRRSLQEAEDDGPAY